MTTAGDSEGEVNKMTMVMATTAPPTAAASNCLQGVNGDGDGDEDEERCSQEGDGGYQGTGRQPGTRGTGPMRLGRRT